MYPVPSPTSRPADLLPVAGNPSAFPIDSFLQTELLSALVFDRLLSLKILLLKSLCLVLLSTSDPVHEIVQDPAHGKSHETWDP